MAFLSEAKDIFLSLLPYYLCLIILTLSEKLGGGENRKTEIQNEGGGGEEDFYLCIYLL